MCIVSPLEFALNKTNINHTFPAASTLCSSGFRISIGSIPFDPTKRNPVGISRLNHSTSHVSYIIFHQPLAAMDSTCSVGFNHSAAWWNPACCAHCVRRVKEPWFWLRVVAAGNVEGNQPVGLSSWWLNQPIWKICASQIGSLPQGSGWK